jgi:hypothetical protein
MKNFGLFIIVAVGLLSCNSKPKTQTETKKNQTVDSVLLSKYEKQLENSTETEKELLKTTISLIKEFSFRTIDTTIYQICHIDSDLIEDTLSTRIYELKNKIIVLTEWKQNGKLNWTKKLENPYLWINENPLYDYEKRDKWITFAIGLKYALPVFHKTTDQPELLETAINLGIQDLKEQGIDVSATDYKNYIDNYKGDLIEVGDPECNDGLLIWYEPIRKFITFYHE